MAESTPDELLAALRRHPVSGTPELAVALHVSVPTVQRLLRRAEGQVVGLGRARRTRYAARRALRGEVADLPVYRVDEAGVVRPFAALALIAPDGAAMPLAQCDWPLPEGSRDGWWPGLPYFLQDMRPQGYLGRQFARAVGDVLQLPADPRAWADDDVLVALAYAGHDTAGDLIIGEHALRGWQAVRMEAPEPLAENGLPGAYAARAEQAVAGTDAGSSVAGECAKFAALRTIPDPDRAGPGGAVRTPHALVKFSGAGDTPVEQRWRDLLRAEHWALRCLAANGVPAARSRVLEAAGRTFLEVERFDRHGRWGRGPLVSLEAVNAAFLGLPHRAWPGLVAPLERMGVLTEGTREQVALLWWFGTLIGNTDMHLGNLSFRPVNGRLALAPAYDMLPMRYAPLVSGELRPLALAEPALPLPTERDAWLAAARMALTFWQRVGQDDRVSGAMRAQAQSSAERLDLAMRVMG